MSYIVKMVLLDKVTDAEAGIPIELLAGAFRTVSDANDAGEAEIKLRGLPPGSITYRVYDGNKEVDEAGMGLS